MIHHRHEFRLGLLSILVYINSLPCGFVFDDISAVVDNKDLRPHYSVTNLFWHDFWGTPMSREHSHKSYRPLCVLTFRLNYLLHELEPWGYHLVNILLHALVSILYYKVSLAFVSHNVKVAKICSYLFAVHPVHAEAVTGVVGRAELLSSVFFLLTILTYKNAVFKGLWSHLAISMASVGCAMLCKEQGITVLGILVCYELFIVQNLDLRNLSTWIKSGNNNELTNLGKQPFWPCFIRLVTVICTGILLLLSRFIIMGHTLPVFTNFDNPASYADTPAKQLTWAYLVPVNFWLLLAPAQLLCDWTMGTIPLVTTLADPRNIATLILFVILAHLAYAALSNNRALLMSLALLAVPFLPASNLFFPVGFVVAERVLYVPSMGYCLLVALGFNALLKMMPTKKQFLWCCLVYLVVVNGLRCLVRNQDWRTEESIFLAGLKVSQNNAKLWNNVGHALESKKEYSQALTFFQQATSAQPDDVGAHINVGRTLNHLERYSEAESAYLKAKSLLPQPKPGQRYVTRIAPQHLSVFLNLGNLMAKDPGRLEEADLLYRQAIAMRNDYVQAYINRGDVLIKMGKANEAYKVYQEALNFEPDNADLHYNLGVVLIELGKPNEALEMFNNALQVDSEHLQSLMNSAILMQESGIRNLRPLAYERLFKVMDRQPENDRIYFNLGMLSMDDGYTNKAESWFKKAIELRPDFRSALFNLALLLERSTRPLEALPYLDSLLKYFPEHIKGLVLLGDIYTNHVKDLEKAEKAYRRILEIDPKHVQGYHNLCVVMVNKKDLKSAYDCLMEVHKLAPHEAYIKKHLAIVESRLQGQK